MVLITKNLEVYDEATFGMDTWGNPYHQYSLEKARKNWYIKTWHPSCEGAIEYDVVDKIKLDVIKEFENYDEAISWLSRMIGVIKEDKEEWEHFERCMKNGSGV